MDAVAYLKEKARMTGVAKDGGCLYENCKTCGLGVSCNNKDMDCEAFETIYPEEAVAVVEKWSKEHPRKTYLADFLKHYPNTILKNLDYICRKSIHGQECFHFSKSCTDCWNEEMED